MIDVCPKDIATYILSETYPTGLPAMDVIICNWTLHFIKDKLTYLKAIKDNLHDKGTLILSEKTTLDPLMIEKYHEFKIQKGVSEEEIKVKSWEPFEIKSVLELIKMPTKDMWRECMEALGEEYLIWSNTPDNPSYN